MATVTLSLASMKRCSVSCRSLLLPTAGMMSAAVFGRGVLFAVDDEARDVRERRMSLRGACFRVIVSAEQIVRALGRDASRKSASGRKRAVAPAGALVVELPLRKSSSFGRWYAKP